MSVMKKVLWGYGYILEGFVVFWRRWILNCGDG